MVLHEGKLDHAMMVQLLYDIKEAKKSNETSDVIARIRMERKYSKLKRKYFTVIQGGKDVREA